MTVAAAWARMAGALVAALLLVALTVEPSFAASSICRKLEAELAGAGSGRSAAKARRYDAALARQQQQLRAARQQLRARNCGFFLFGGADCKAARAGVQRLEASVAALENQRPSSAEQAPRRPRNQILASLRANGCRQDTAAARRQPRNAERMPTALGRILDRDDARALARLDDDFLGEDDEDGGDDVRRIPGTEQPAVLRPSGEPPLSVPPGRYRTLCVRTCDGYFFPMSTTASSMEFERDRQNCRSICPGAEVQLYYHRVGQESEAMISAATGEPYADLTTAFLYKKPGVPRPASCGCSQASGSFSIVAGSEPARELESEPIIPAPISRPDPAADPETLANAGGGLTVDTLRRLAAPPAPVPPAGNGEPKVRVVGPVFLPDPAGAIDLRAPAPKEVR